MWDLHDQNGQRKYLAKDEIAAFVRAAEQKDRSVRTFCGLLVYRGCRVLGALALTAARVGDSPILFYWSETP